MLLAQRQAFGADNPLPRLQLADALAPMAMAESVQSAAGSSGNITPLQLQLTAEPQDFPDDDEDIPDLTRSGLPERERRSAEQAEIPNETTKKREPFNKNLFGMTLAPIRWGGYTQDFFRYTQNTEQSPTLDHSQQLDLHAESYIWQPWFALVNGNIGIGRGVQSSDNNGDTKVNSLTGTGTLQVFPQSRFPFTASFSASDSTTNSSLSESGTRSERFSFRQQYRPKTGNATFAATYDNSVIRNRTSGDDSVINWRGMYGDQIGFHGISVELTRTESEREQGREGLLLDAINATHSYSPKPGLSITSTAHLSDSEQRQFQDIASQLVDTTHSRYLQASSSANWRPKEDLPLNFSGGINFFKVESDVNGGDPSESQSLNGNLGVSYFFNPTPQLTIGLSGSVMALTATSDEIDQRSVYFTENATANYAGDPLTLGNFSYNWNLNSNVIHQTLKSNLTESSSTYSMTAGGSHNLNRMFRLNETSTINLAINQSLTSRWSGQSDQNSTLSTGGNVSWQVTPSNSTSASIHLSATDTRMMGSQTSDSQYLTLQGNGRIQLSGYSNLTATAGFQWNRQGASSTDANSQAPVSTYTNINIAYQHSRAFKINNLSYTAQGTWNMQNTDSGDQGGAGGNEPLIGYSLDQRLQYRLGRIDLGAAATFTYQDGKENALLWLHVGRTFGNY